MTPEMEHCRVRGRSFAVVSRVKLGGIYVKWHGELTEMREWIKSAQRFLDSHSFGVAVAAALVVIALGAGFTAWKWDSLHGDSTGTNVSTTLRNMGLLIAGGLAIVFAAWRGWVAERQSATAQKQVAIAQEQSDIAQQACYMIAISAGLRCWEAKSWRFEWREFTPFNAWRKNTLKIIISK